MPTDRGYGGSGNAVSSGMARLYYEFLFKAEYAYDYGMPQSIVRADRILHPFHLERLFLGRHKFYHFRVWYRDQLSDYVKQILLDERTLGRPYLDRAFVEKMVKEHTNGTRNYTVEISKVLTMELIQRKLIGMS